MKETDAISVAIGMYNDGYDKGIDDLLEKAKLKTKKRTFTIAAF